MLGEDRRLHEIVMLQSRDRAEQRLDILKIMGQALDIRSETIGYTAKFARPAFDLWGKGGKITEGLYDLLTPYGATLQTFTAPPSLVNAAAPVLTIGLNFGTVKFSYDSVEFTFTDFSDDFFQSIPLIFSGCDHWLRRTVSKFDYARHEFHYFNHSYIKDGTTEAVLARTNPTTFNSGGVALGTGAIFHHAVPEKKWLTRFIIDKSIPLPNGLFMGINFTILDGFVSYPEFVIEARAYLVSLLDEIGLSLPDLAGGGS